MIIRVNILDSYFLEKVSRLKQEEITCFHVCIFQTKTILFCYSFEFVWWAGGGGGGGGNVFCRFSIYSLNMCV